MTDVVFHAPVYQGASLTREVTVVSITPKSPERSSVITSTVLETDDGVRVLSFEVQSYVLRHRHH